MIVVNGAKVPSILHCFKISKPVKMQKLESFRTLQGTIAA